MIFLLPFQLTRTSTLSSSAAPRTLSQFTRSYNLSDYRGSTTRYFSFTKRRLATNHEETAKSLNQKGLDAQESEFNDAAIAEAKEKQTRTPWHREGSNLPPVRRLRSAGAMTKGTRQLLIVCH
jgi:hypothetical protein